MKISICSLISKIEVKLQKIYIDKRDAIRKEEILSAVVKSGRSYEEIMNFLNAGSDGEKTEK